LGRTVNYISCVFIGYKNVFGPITVLVGPTKKSGRLPKRPLKFVVLPKPDIKTVTSTVDNSSVLVEKGLLQAQNMFKKMSFRQCTFNRKNL
jgi:hypothetical protein